MGIKQCCWARYPKPTQLLSDIPGLAKEGWVGPPLLDDKRIYIGPIPACIHSHKVELVGRSKSGQHMTKETECAAWPPGRCEMVAERIVNDSLESPCCRKAAEPTLTQGVGESSQAEPDTSDGDSIGRGRPRLGAGRWGRGPPAGLRYVVTPPLVPRWWRLVLPRQAEETAAHLAQWHN